MEQNGPRGAGRMGMIGNTLEAVRKLPKVDWREIGSVRIKISPPDPDKFRTGKFTGKSFFFNIEKKFEYDYAISPSDDTTPEGVEFLELISTEKIGFLLVNIEVFDDLGNPTGNTYPNVRIIKQNPGRDIYEDTYRIGQDIYPSMGGSIRSHYRKRKSSRHVSNKKYSMGRRGRNRGRSRRGRGRSSRKN